MAEAVEALRRGCAYAPARRGARRRQCRATASSRIPAPREAHQTLGMLAVNDNLETTTRRCSALTMRAVRFCCARDIEVPFPARAVAGFVALARNKCWVA